LSVKESGDKAGEIDQASDAEVTVAELAHAVEEHFVEFLRVAPDFDDKVVETDTADEAGVIAVEVERAVE
jgi:hypothetical protein